MSSKSCGRIENRKKKSSSEWMGWEGEITFPKSLTIITGEIQSREGPGQSKQNFRSTCILLAAAAAAAAVAADNFHSHHSHCRTY